MRMRSRAKPRRGDRAGRLLLAAVATAFAGGVPTQRGGLGTVLAAGLDLDKPVHAAWTGVPLRTWAAGVAEIAGRPVVIDRRLDPDAAVTLDASGEPLVAVLEKVARASGAEVVPLRSSVRIVPLKSPAAACDRAEHAREQAVGKLPAAGRQAVVRRAAWGWPDGARPRDLVKEALDAAGLAAEGIDRVPHDHFPAASLPPLSLGERLDLLLAHFDLRIDWRTGAAGPVAAIVAIDAGLPATVPKQGVPHAGHTGNDRPKSPDRKQPRPEPGTTSKTKQTFTLAVAAPLEEVLTAVAGRLRVMLDIDRAVLEARGISAREIVRVEVRDLSADELLAAILGPLGLTGKVVGERLEVRGAPPP